MYHIMLWRFLTGRKSISLPSHFERAILVVVHFPQEGAATSCCAVVAEADPSTQPPPAGKEYKDPCDTDGFLRRSQIPSGTRTLSFTNSTCGPFMTAMAMASVIFKDLSKSCPICVISV